MEAMCAKKHSNGTSCHMAKYTTVVRKDGSTYRSLDLASYARTHPPKGGVNFYEELVDLSHRYDEGRARPPFVPEGRRGPSRGPFKWEFHS